MATASAPGKVILFGEHSIVYPGHTGIAAAIRTQYSTIATAEKHDKDVVIIDAPGIGFGYMREHDSAGVDRLAPVKQVLVDIFKSHAYTPLGVKIVSDFPAGAHIGTGTAASAATAASVLAELGYDLDKERISSLAFEGDIIAHGGTPSGIDSTVIANGGFIEYHRTETGKKFSPITISYSIPALVWHSGESSKTSEMVANVRKKVERFPEVMLKYFEEINQIALTGRDYLKQGNLQGVGNCMTANHAILRKIGVSTTRLDELVAFLEKQGVFGAKLTGAGGGGCVVALGEQKLLEKIHDTNKDTFLVNLGAEGVRLEKSF